LIVMLLLGGLGTLNGAIVGTVAYLLLEEWLSGFTENWKVIFGPLLVLVVLFARGGLLGLATALTRRLGRD
jgi:branched-chain amino acid transport system permease protein